jgi:hypothetical protein
MDALAFLRGEESYGALTTLDYWASHAGLRPEVIKGFFSSGKETTWIPFVITLRSPYRRARKGASAPQEASFADLWGAYMGRKPMVFGDSDDLRAPSPS